MPLLRKKLKIKLSGEIFQISFPDFLGGTGWDWVGQVSWDRFEKKILKSDINYIIYLMINFVQLDMNSHEQI